MLAKRRATKQVAFRVEPAIAAEWGAFVRDSLVPARAHLISAMLMYRWASAEQRQLAQAAYARFLRGGRLEGPRAVPPAGPSLSAKESELLAAYRNASDGARRRAAAELLDTPADGEPPAGPHCEGQDPDEQPG